MRLFIINYRLNLQQINTQNQLPIVSESLFILLRVQEECIIFVIQMMQRDKLRKA